MSDTKLPEDLPLDAGAWIQTFCETLELEFLDIAKSTFSKDADKADFHQTAIFAIRRLLEQDGITEEQLQQSYSDDKFGWSDGRNQRRCELIDKETDETISFEEAQELESLTFQMRYALKRVHDERVGEAQAELQKLKNDLGIGEKK